MTGLLREVPDKVTHFEVTVTSTTEMDDFEMKDVLSDFESLSKIVTVSVSYGLV